MKYKILLLLLLVYPFFHHTAFAESDELLGSSTQTQGKPLFRALKTPEEQTAEKEQKDRGGGTSSSQLRVKPSGVGERKEVNSQMKEKRKEALLSNTRKIFTRYEAAINRFEKLIQRIEERLVKMKNEGKDVTTATKQIEATKGKLIQVKKDFEALKVFTETFINSEDPKTYHEEFKQKNNLVRDQILGLYQGLLQVMANIKTVYTQEDKKPEISNKPTVQTSVRISPTTAVTITDTSEQSAEGQ